MKYHCGADKENPGKILERGVLEMTVISECVDNPEINPLWIIFLPVIPIGVASRAMKDVYYHIKDVGHTHYTF